MSSSGREIYLRLLREVIPHRRVFIIAIIAMAILGLTEPTLAAMLKPTFDGSFVERDVRTVTKMALLLVALFFARGVASYVSALCLASVSSHVIMGLRQQMLRKLVYMPARVFDDTNAGALMSKVTYDATQLDQSATHVLTTIIRDSIVIIGLLAWMLWLNWKLTIVALVTAPIVVLVVRHFSSRLRRTSSELQSLMGEMTHVLQEAIGGWKVVRSFSAQDEEQQRFYRIANRVRQFEVKFQSAANIIAPIAQLAAACGLAIMIYMAALESAADRMTVGTFASFFAAMGLIFPPIKRLTGINARLQRGIAAASSVFSLIDEASEPDTGQREIERARGELRFVAVSFRYPSTDARAVNEVTLEVAPGETLALVGPSGSGKSTLAALVARFHDPDHGTVLLDGVDLRELTLRSLRAQVALVSQDVVLFEGTVRENIAYGPLATRDEKALWQAIDAASAREFVEQLPQGIDTPVGSQGLRLSGGQRQRIAIARAFLKDAPILILDEATSALDNRTERDIQQALARLSAGRTTLVIAHRLSSIEHANRIAVLDSGRIVDTGTHHELLERNGLYAALYRFQFSHDAHAESNADSVRG